MIEKLYFKKKKKKKIEILLIKHITIIKIKFY